MVYYLHGDHLGSTSLTTDQSGNKFSEVRYLPYGQERVIDDTPSPTDFGFTGQRKDGFGLYDYNARFYSPYLNRFVSPDSIIPDPANPQNLNRYAYARNNPVGHTDPSGHCLPEECPWSLTQELVDSFAFSQGMDRYHNGVRLVAALNQDPTTTSINVRDVQAAKSAVLFDMEMVLRKEGPLEQELYNETLEEIATSGGSLASGGGLTKAAGGAGLIKKLFGVGRHGDMPSPREGSESHHGIMSKWMETHYSKYNPDDAPAILMPQGNHNATRSYFNQWRAQMKKAMGGTFDWNKVSEGEIRQLANGMMDAAEVPQSDRDIYWQQFNEYLDTLR